MIDLHIHSTASDGFFAPKEILKLALELQMEAIALTDHDAVSGIDELKKSAKGKNIEIVNGAELSVYYPNTDMEILALDIPDNALKEFKKFQKEELKRRMKITETRLRILNEWGYDIKFEEVAFDEKGNQRTQIRRPHFVDVLLKKGYIKTPDEAYKKIFVKRGGCFVENKPRDAKEVIEFIKDNGAVAILAHPVHTKKVKDDLFELFKELKGYGLDGVEVIHSSHSKGQRKSYLKMIEELKMISAGGSDFHGGNAHPENKLGSGKNNNVRIPYFVLSELKENRGKVVSKNYYEELFKVI